MESRLKERLTGAAIIVALIVLLVPEMFRGQRHDSSSPSSSSASGGDGPPMRSYSIDLSNAPTHNPPTQSAQPAPASAAVASAAAINSSANNPSSPDTAAPESAASSASVPEPLAVPTPVAPTPINSAHASVPHASTHVDAAPPARASAGGGWSVQLGIFGKRDNAERLTRAASQKGFSVSVSAADAKGQFRVHAVGLADRGSAQTLANRLKLQGFAAAVVAPQ